MGYIGFAARVLRARNGKTVNFSTHKDRLDKIHYIMLMCKLSAISKFYQGHVWAFKSKISTWILFILFWNTNYVNKQIQMEMLTII